MAIPTYHCVTCEKEFKAGDWECVSGEYHVVKSKIYYMDDAPTVVQYDALNNRHPYIDKKSSQTRVLNIPPERMVRHGDDVVRQPGGDITFVRGLYETSNPEIQFYLDKKPGLVTKERWEEVYLNDDEKLQMARLKVKAEQSRLQQENNELLERVKAFEAKEKKKSPAGAAV